MSLTYEQQRNLVKLRDRIADGDYADDVLSGVEQARLQFWRWLKGDSDCLCGLDTCQCVEDDETRIAH